MSRKILISGAALMLLAGAAHANVVPPGPLGVLLFHKVVAASDVAHTRRGPLASIEAHRPDALACAWGPVAWILMLVGAGGLGAGLRAAPSPAHIGAVDSPSRESASPT